VAWHGDTPGRTILAYALGAIVIYSLISIAIAVGTYDSACGHADAPKEWQFVPPAWECKSPFHPR
jgi:hypothetical protein